MFSPNMPFYLTFVQSRSIANLFRSNDTFSQCWNKPRHHRAYIQTDELENRRARDGRECASEPWTRGELVRVCASRHSHGISSYVLQNIPFWHLFRLFPRFIAILQILSRAYLHDLHVFTRASAMKKWIFYGCHFFFNLLSSFSLSSSYKLN